MSKESKIFLWVGPRSHKDVLIEKEEFENISSADELCRAGAGSFSPAQEYDVGFGRCFVCLIARIRLSACIYRQAPKMRVAKRHGVYATKFLQCFRSVMNRQQYKFIRITSVPFFL